MNSFTAVNTTYDPQNQTWNVLDDSNNCLFYGSITGLEEWLDNHKDTHKEIIH